MPTAKINATEMKDANVVRISLVERGANRSPFKVLKKEKSMFKHLDLAGVFTRKSEEKPVLVAVCTMKGEGFEAVKTAMAAAGIKVDKAEDSVDAEGKADGSVIFAQTDSPEEDLKGEFTTVRLSDSAVLVVKGFRPYSMSMQVGDEGSFEEVCKAQGFYPGVGTMVDVLRSSVLTLAEKSDNPDEAATAIQQMFKEAGEYAVSMVKALPSQAFKLDNMDYPMVSYKAEGEGEGEPAEGEEEPAAPAEEPAEGEQAPAEEQAAEPVVKAEQAPGLSAEDITALVTKALGEGLAPLVETLTSVQKSVSDVSDSVKEIDARVVKAEQAVAGTVVLGSDGGDDTGEDTRVRKSEVDREIDTGFSPRIRRAGRS